MTPAMGSVRRRRCLVKTATTSFALDMNDKQDMGP